MNRIENVPLTNSTCQPGPAHNSTSEIALSSNRRKMYNRQSEVFAQAQAPLPGVLLL